RGWPGPAPGPSPPRRTRGRASSRSDRPARLAAGAPPRTARRPRYGRGPAPTATSARILARDRSGPAAPTERRTRSGTPLRPGGRPAALGGPAPRPPHRGAGRPPRGRARRGAPRRRRARRRTSPPGARTPSRAATGNGGTYGPDQGRHAALAVGPPGPMWATGAP